MSDSRERPLLPPPHRACRKVHLWAKWRQQMLSRARGYRHSCPHAHGRCWAPRSRGSWGLPLRGMLPPPRRLGAGRVPAARGLASTCQHGPGVTAAISRRGKAGRPWATAAPAHVRSARRRVRARRGQCALGRTFVRKEPRGTTPFIACSRSTRLSIVAPALSFIARFGALRPFRPVLIVGLVFVPKIPSLSTRV